MGLLTARTKAKLKGLLPAVAVLVNLAALVYFKYANFLIDTLNRIGNFGLASLGCRRGAAPGHQLLHL